MLASFQLAGTAQTDNDKLNKWLRDGTVSLATFLNNLPGIPSGPQAFLGCSASATSETVNWKLDGLQLDIEGGDTASGSTSTGLKTDWKKVFSRLALLVLSIKKYSPSRRKVGLRLLYFFLQRTRSVWDFHALGLSVYEHQ